MKAERADHLMTVIAFVCYWHTLIEGKDEYRNKL